MAIQTCHLRDSVALVLAVGSTAFILSVPVIGQDLLPVEGIRFTKVGYLGGAIGFRGISPNADNTLVVSPTTIRFEIKDGPVVEIDPAKVEVLEYAGIRARPEALWEDVAAAVMMPIMALTLLDRVKNHYIVIEYVLPAPAEGKAGLMITGNKDNYIPILKALATSTGLLAKSIPAPK